MPPSRNPEMGVLTLAFLAVLAFALVFIAACGGNANEPASTPPGSTAAIEGEITVFAAASLTDAFTKVGEAFEAEHDVDVAFNFGSSSALATQINEGAPADLFASADGAQMRIVADAGNAGTQTIFATNLPVVIVPADGSPIASFEDLAASGYNLVLAGPDVPIGRYTREILTAASAASGGISADFANRVLANLKSNEANVRAVLTKVQLGEAEAGFVYSTDAAVGGEDVKSIEIPAEYNIIAEYPIATVSDSENPDAAEAFVAFVLSEPGQDILRSFGFGGLTTATNR